MSLSHVMRVGAQPQLPGPGEEGGGLSRAASRTTSSVRDDAHLPRDVSNISRKPLRVTHYKIASHGSRRGDIWLHVTQLESRDHATLTYYVVRRTSCAAPRAPRPALHPGPLARISLSLPPPPAFSRALRRPPHIARFVPCLPLPLCPIAMPHTMGPMFTCLLGIGMRALPRMSQHACTKPSKIFRRRSNQPFLASRHWSSILGC
ncbi:LAQU0S01e07822g1_1 [Lachancea quebecensis]|uniref:LAQU0S01e07822g1_1 n=1 Tax=Lachancea quebecensis TaxID=1654605 RepID=A0A0P1KMA6_9SACH|nr:LAQU0S01e07822g1_1 [Lachancea quebecensis]